jgi:hypothetical protein
MQIMHWVTHRADWMLDCASAEWLAYYNNLKIFLDDTLMQQILCHQHYTQSC